MKTQNNKLVFNTHTMVELSDKNMLDIEGGSTPAATSSGGCMVLAGAAVAALIKLF